MDSPADTLRCGTLTARVVPVNPDCYRLEALCAVCGPMNPNFHPSLALFNTVLLAEEDFADMAETHMMLLHEEHNWQHSPLRN